MSEVSPFEKRLLGVVATLQNEASTGLTFEEGKGRVDGILDALGYCEDFTAEQVGDSLAAVLLLPDVCAAASKQPYEEQSLLYRTEMADYLSRHGYVELFVKMSAVLETHITPDEFHDDSPAVYNFFTLCSGFLNYSDKSPRIGEDFGNNGGVELTMRIIKTLDRNICQRGMAGNNSCNGQLKILQSAMGILHNCTRHNSCNRHIYRRANVVDFFESKTSSEHLNIRIASVLLLAQIADERVAERVAPNLDCVLLLVELLKRAVVSRQHYINVVGEHDGDSRYSAQELTNALSHLAINDANKAAIQTCGGIPILVCMLQNEFSDEESLEAFTLIWHLVFVESVKREEVMQDIVEIFQMFTKAKAYVMREIASYILWEMRDHQMTFPSEPDDDPEYEKPPFYLSVPVSDDTKSRSGCIMISCQHDSKMKALFIKDKLGECGFNVWMNECPLRERSLEERTAAVQQSVIILVCVTEKYKESPSCRSEASYAKKLGKPMIPLLIDSEYQPDGWLEKLLGTNAKYHRFCTDEDMDTSLAGLVDELGDRGKASPVRSLGIRFKSAMKKFRTTLGNNEGKGSKSSGDQDETYHGVSRNNARYWSSQRLQIWLKENGLEKVCLPPELCQGNQLTQMYGHYRKAPDKFTSALKSDFNLDDKTVKKFLTALCSLFD